MSRRREQQELEAVLALSQQQARPDGSDAAPALFPFPATLYPSLHGTLTSSTSSAPSTATAAPVHRTSSDELALPFALPSVPFSLPGLRPSSTSDPASGPSSIQTASHRILVPDTLVSATEAISSASTSNNKPLQLSAALTDDISGARMSNETDPLAPNTSNELPGDDVVGDSDGEGGAQHLPLSGESLASGLAPPPARKPFSSAMAASMRLPSVNSLPPLPNFPVASTSASTDPIVTSSTAATSLTSASAAPPKKRGRGSFEGCIIEQPAPAAKPKKAKTKKTGLKTAAIYKSNATISSDEDSLDGQSPPAKTKRKPVKAKVVDDEEEEDDSPLTDYDAPPSKAKKKPSLTKSNTPEQPPASPDPIDSLAAPVEGSGTSKRARSNSLSSASEIEIVKTTTKKPAAKSRRTTVEAHSEDEAGQAALQAELEAIRAREDEDDDDFGAGGGKKKKKAAPKKKAALKRVPTVKKNSVGGGGGAEEPVAKPKRGRKKTADVVETASAAEKDDVPAASASSAKQPSHVASSDKEDAVVLAKVGAGGKGRKKSAIVDSEEDDDAASAAAAGEEEEPVEKPKKGKGKASGSAEEKKASTAGKKRRGVVASSDDDQHDDASDDAATSAILTGDESSGSEAVGSKKKKAPAKKPAAPRRRPTVAAAAASGAFDTPAPAGRSVSPAKSAASVRSAAEKHADRERRESLLMDAAMGDVEESFIGSVCKGKAPASSQDSEKAKEKAEGKGKGKKATAPVKAKPKGKGKGKAAEDADDEDDEEVEEDKLPLASQSSSKSDHAKENEGSPVKGKASISTPLAGRGRSTGTPFSKKPKAGSLAAIMQKKGFAAYRAPGLSVRSKVPSLHTNLKPPPAAKKLLVDKPKPKKKGDESYSDEEKPWWKKIDWEEATDEQLARWKKRQQKIERGVYVSDNE